MGRGSFFENIEMDGHISGTMDKKFGKIILNLNIWVVNYHLRAFLLVGGGGLKLV